MKTIKLKASFIACFNKDTDELGQAISRMAENNQKKN